MPAIILACSIWMIMDFQQSAWLRRYGRSAKAQIINRRAVLYMRPNLFFVTYQFQTDDPNGQGSLLYTRQQGVMWKTYRRLKDVNVTTVDVLFAPTNPQKSQLAGQHEDHVGRLFALYTGLPVAIIWFALLLDLLRMYKG